MSSKIFVNYLVQQCPGLQIKVSGGCEEIRKSMARARAISPTSEGRHHRLIDLVGLRLIKDTAQISCQPATTLNQASASSASDFVRTRLLAPARKSNSSECSSLSLIFPGDSAFRLRSTDYPLGLAVLFRQATFDDSLRLRINTRLRLNYLSLSLEYRLHDVQLGHGMVWRRGCEEKGCPEERYPPTTWPAGDVEQAREAPADPDG